MLLISIEKFLAKTSRDDCEGGINMRFGTYSYTQQGEEFIDGQRANVTWNIATKDDKNACVVQEIQWHFAL